MGFLSGLKTGGFFRAASSENEKPANYQRDPLSIIIVGAGKVGIAIIEQLIREGNNITLIDQDKERIEEVSNAFDILGIVGNGASYSVQKEAGIFDADLFIAVTDSDELNLLCCTVAKQVGNCAGIARVRTPDYSSEVNYLRDRLGLAMIINPELEAAREISRILYLPSALEVNTYAHGEAEIIKFKIKGDSPLVNQSVLQYSNSHSDEMLFCSVERDDDVYIPNGSFIFREGDVASFATAIRNGRSCMNSLNIPTIDICDCLIVGGGKGAFYLARILSHNNIRIKIIEKNAARCRVLSEAFPHATIINGDGTDEQVLREAGIETCDAFVPLTGMDEENIILTLHANQVSDAKVVTKINRFAFKNVIKSLDLGSIVYPKYITASAIIAYARARRASIDSNIETLYHLHDHRIESIEFTVDAESSVTGVPLKDLKLKDNTLISFINRAARIFFPGGNDTIEVGDSVMIVTKHSGFDDITDILS